MNAPVVATLDPVVQLGITGRRELEPLASAVKARMERVLDAVAAGGTAAEKQRGGPPRRHVPTRFDRHTA